MKKVVKVRLDGKTYYDVGVEKLNEQNFTAAAYNFYKSYKLSGSYKPLLELGELYLTIGQPVYALEHLFVAYKKAKNKGEISLAIAECFSELDDDELAFYYFTPEMTVRQYKDLISDVHQTMQERTDFKIKPKQELNERSDAGMMHIAARLFNSGDYKYAMDLAKSVKKSSALYAEANNIIAVCLLNLDRPTEAAQYIEQSIAHKDNAIVRCTQLTLCHELGDSEGMNRARQRLEQFTLDMEDRRAVISTYMRIGDLEKATHHLQRVLDEDKYDRDAMVGYALALYNSGRQEEARTTMINAAYLYPFDSTISLLLKQISDGETLGLLPAIGESMIAAMGEQIEQKLKEGKENEIPELYIEWMFQNSMTKTQSRLVNALIKHESRHEYLLNKLVSYEQDVSTKKIILSAFMRNTDIKSADIVVDGLYVRLKLKMPENMDEQFKNAYCPVFAVFASINTDFESRLYKKTTQLLKRYNAEGFDKTKIVNVNVLSSVIFFCGQGGEIICSMDKSAAIFGVDAKQTKEYYLLFFPEDKNSKKTELAKINGFKIPTRGNND